MRTFYFSDGKSEKFWHIELRDKQVVITSGTIGRKGRAEQKTFDNKFMARFEQDHLIRDKLAAGHAETTHMEAMPPLRRALEAALVADPDDLGAHMAYADWLAEQGDPRGEFIQVQLALEDESRPAAERKRLRKREAVLLKAHRDEWLGALASLVERGQWSDLVAHFARGWVEQLVVPFLSVPLASLLAWEPRLPLVRRLSIPAIADRYGEVVRSVDDLGRPPPEPVEEHADPADVLARSPYLTNVRVLALGEIDRFADEDSDPSWYNTTADLPSFGYEVWEWVARMRGLEELYVTGSVHAAEDLFKSESLTRLRVLQIFLADDYPLKHLAGNKALGNLTHLSLRPRAFIRYGDESKPFIGVKQLLPVLKSRHLKSLTHLRVQQTLLGDEGCEAVVQSGALRRLKFLDLARGSITDAGARALARCPDLTNLEVLDVSRNALTKAGIKALRATGVAVRADDQHRKDDSEYLYEGEME
jgi:uncharacterized protein (TIGR02996 family)